MRLTFLSAAAPLNKAIAYSSRDDEYTTTAYPMVRKVTSREEEVADMFEFYKAIKAAGDNGEALHYGSLKRALVDESRAGMANKDPLHEYICFDFDKVDKPPTIEGALEAVREYLPECCQAPECVIQLSSSCFIPRTSTLSAHVFMRLQTPATTQQLKDFLTWINFNSPKLLDQINLSDSASTLKFKLDRAVVDPSRLLYIAPPRFVGFTPESKETLGHFGGSFGISLPPIEPVPRSTLNALINDLRAMQGYEPKDYKTVKMYGSDVIKGVDAGVISDLKTSSTGYLRFNLNGGDSLGYWIDLKNVEVIGNFKGEPGLLTKEIDPEFYKRLIKATKSTPQQHRGAEGQEVLAFYATNRASTLYIGTYERGTDKLRVDRSSETACGAWLKQFGIPLHGALPHFDLTYDISSDIRYEEGYPVINLYERTDLMKQYGNMERTNSLKTTMDRLDNFCPITMMFLRSITGDPRSAEVFINWLAFIFQTRTKTSTAWLLWGTEGTGKGKFLQHVCQPLFGNSSVGQVLFSNVDKQFNSLLEGKLLVNIDEAAMSRTRDSIESMSKLRNWITEPSIVINEKGIPEREIPSFVNFIISSNDHRPLIINNGDRRLHIGTRQEKRLIPTANEYATLVQGEELPHFAQMLGALKVDEVLVRTPEMTESKSRLFESTHSLIDTVAMAITDGDTGFFFEARPSNLALGASSSAALLPIKQYDDLLRRMVDKSLTLLKHEDLYVLFHIVVNDTKIFPENPTAQKQIFARYGLSAVAADIYLDKRTGEKDHGIKAPRWKSVPDHQLSKINLTPPRSVVTPIRG